MQIVYKTNYKIGICFIQQGKRRGAKNCRFSGTSSGAINRPKRLKRGMANGSIDRTQQSCLQCGKLFKTAGSLARHVETRHSSIEDGKCLGMKVCACRIRNTFFMFCKQNYF